MERGHLKELVLGIGAGLMLLVLPQAIATTFGHHALIVLLGAFFTSVAIGIVFDDRRRGKRARQKSG
jgi:hypothetical protein